MRAFDPNADDPFEWRAAFAEWKAQVAAARRAQTTALAALHSAETTRSALVAWRDTLAAVSGAMAGRVAPYAAANAAIAELDAGLDRTEGELTDRLHARDAATTRLIDGPPATTPVVLLPVRVHTAWLPDGLAVRFVPSELSVDRHDPRLSPLELTLGRAYWATRGLGGAAQAEQAWRDITSRLPAPRAAWIVRATAPTATAPPATRDGELDLAVTVRLLPDRFAVVLLAAGEPVDVAAGTGPPRYVTWGEPVAADLAVPLLHTADDRPWTTDLGVAVAAGMAVRIALPATATPVDEVVAVGIRAGSSGTDLGDLLTAHTYSVGTELLPAGTPTNNTAADRTRRTTAWERELSRLLVDDTAAAPPAGSAGAALAAVLGIPAPVAGLVGGSTAPRDDLYDAVAALVAATAQGTLSTDAASGSTTAPEAVAALRPAGPAPILRVGTQPFGVLPAVDANRYAGGPGGLDAALAAGVRAAARRQLVPLDVDPSDPAPAAAPALRVTATDDSALAQVLAEAATTLRWSVNTFRGPGDPATGPAGETGVLGPADGPGAPQVYLPALAAGGTDQAVLAAAAGSLLGAMALTVAPTPDGPALLGRVAAVLAEHGRPALATAVATHLDALSHRVDAWVTAAATRRLAAASDDPVVGAYGYATDLAPRHGPRSFGHIHAPSAAHAVTAGVLRSGYLGQRRAAWADRLATALAAADEAGAAAARTGLESVAPLDDGTESRLPMAVDLTSTRVRRARGVLAAVRGGQRLAVVLGRQVERALVVAGLSAYLAPLRKLTRFTAGTALEVFERARRDAARALATVRTTVDQLGAAAAEAEAAAAAAHVALAAAQTQYDALRDLFIPYAALDTERGQVQAGLDAALARVADLEAHRPSAGSHNHPVNVP
jgi:hypothetical protein